MNRNSLLKVKTLPRTRAVRVISGVDFNRQDTSDFNRRALMGSIAAIVAGYTALSERQKVMAKEAEAQPPPAASVAAAEPEKPKKFKIKRMQEYENKIRMHSQPDKVFRYFATVAAYYEGN